mgnify:CR=1 FL=1
MAKESVAILKGRIDVSEVLDELNAALSEEWLAFYQYWVGALVVKGAMRGDVQREFQEHAMEEFEHAKLIADRIIELEGVPVLDPKKWFDLAKCAYTPPTDVDVVKLLKQNVAAERCAILRYQTIAALTDGKDFTTCDIAKHILAEEEDHEQDLQDYLDDIAHNQIADTDYRKKNFNATETTVGDFTYPAYSNVKFNTPTYEADEIYMRLSEAYLLKAEAEARGGNSSAAQQTLYDLVSKRDSGYAKSSNTGEALLKEIFLQSRIELWGEGHEFFTNKRFNVGVDRTASSNHTHKLVKAAGKEFTYQIPLSIELNSNPYINAADQNPL